jgi:hypothetical protein
MIQWKQLKRRNFMAYVLLKNIVWGPVPTEWIDPYEKLLPTELEVEIDDEEGSVSAWDIEAAAKDEATNSEGWPITQCQAYLALYNVKSVDYD